MSTQPTDVQPAVAMPDDDGLWSWWAERRPDLTNGGPTPHRVQAIRSAWVAAHQPPPVNDDLLQHRDPTTDPEFAPGDPDFGPGRSVDEGGHPKPNGGQPELVWDGLTVDAAPVPRAVVPEAAPEERRLRFTSIAEMTRPTNADAWHVEGLWRPNTLGAIASFEGIGKSYARLQAGLLLAAGRGALFGRYTISGPCIVAVADEENGDAEEWRREEECLAYLGLTRSDVAHYHRVSFAGLVLGDPAWQAELQAEMVRLGEAGLPVALFLDTVTAMHDGKEWGEELKPIVRYLRGLLHRLAFLTIVLIVHVRKPSGEERGLDTELSSVMGNWTRLADSVAILAPLTDGHARWRVHKRVPPSDIVLVREAGGWRYVADYAGKAVAGIDPLDLLDLAREHGQIEARDVMRRFGVSKKPALQAMREHPGLDSATTGARGALVAWPKEQP